jgi:hypothetical protein
MQLNKYYSSVLLDAVSWSAVAFLIFVAILLIIAIVLILYFEKLCCFARYRFLKHLLRRLTRTKAPISTIPSIASTQINKLEEEKKASPEIQEHLWIAGQPEHITTFEASVPLATNDVGE